MAEVRLNPTGADPSGRKLLAAAGAAGVEHLAAADGRHAGSESVAALANELAGLISPLHVSCLQMRKALNARARPSSRRKRAANREKHCGAFAPPGSALMPREGGEVNRRLPAPDQASARANLERTAPFSPARRILLIGGAVEPNVRLCPIF